LSACGRKQAAELLFDLVYYNGLVLTPETAKAVVRAWCMPDYPEWTLGARVWVEFFTAVGYTHDGHAADRPGAAVQLYRGCVPALIENEADGVVVDTRFRMA
jgi:hypothetical protein